MNKQKPDAGIEWTHIRLPDGTQLPGYTANPIRGCQHACRWKMPDGKLAICYAEHIATHLAQNAYPDGFAALSFHRRELYAIHRHREPAAIFIDSMSDLMGRGVPTEWIDDVIETMRLCPQHIFLVLTKNAPRLLKFDWPRNAWLGASMPPDFMFGKPLNSIQQIRMLHRSLDVLSSLDVPVRWMSFEPLSWDVAPVVSCHFGAINWAVIGAASDGARTHQPDSLHIYNALMILDAQGVPTFFKGNLEWPHWRAEFPFYNHVVAEKV